MLKAVIYDMDGVLMDSEPFWREAEVKVFNQLGVPLTEEMCYQTMGMRIDEVVDYWHERHPWKHGPKKEVIKQIHDGVEDLIYLKGKALPGVEHSLDYFKSLGWKIGLATSSDRRLILAVLSKLGLGHYFDATCSAAEEEYGKPHPAVYISTAKKLGIPTYQCLAIEDSFNGLLSAKSARMKTIIIPEAANEDDARWAIADCQLASLEDVDSIEEWSSLN